MEDEDFQQVSAGASATYPQQCSALRKNGYVCIKGRPCKIVDMSTSKTGKHGHAKVHLVGTDIFTGKRLEDLCPSTHNMDVPVVRKAEYQVIDVSEDGFMTLMNDKNETREDLKVPENDLGKEIRAKIEAGDEFMVVVQAAMGEECAIAIKSAA